MDVLRQWLSWTRATELRVIWIWGVLFWGGFMTVAIGFLNHRPTWPSVVVAALLSGLGGYVFGWCLWRRRHR